MKKILSVMLCAIMVLTMAASVLAVDSAKNAGTVAGTSETLTLDAKKDAAYAKGLKLVADSIKDGTKAPGSVTYYVTYTKDALWIFAEVKDSTLDVKNADEKKPSYKADSIEIMLDPTNEGKNEPDVTPWQMRIDSYNLVSARKGQKGASLYLRKAEGGNADFFEAKSVKVDGGFNAEYKIPMDGLKEGKKIGFNFCYNDWTADGKTNRTGTTLLNKSSTSWTAEYYDYMVLGKIAAQTTAATTKAPAQKPTSPATFDAGIILAVVAAAAGAGVVVSKKRK